MYRPSSTVITWAVAGRSSCGAAASPGGRRLARVDIKTMPHVTFTQNIQRHVSCPETEAEGRTVREVLDRVFAANPRARDYVLDDQGAVRRHMVVFVAGRQIRGRAAPTYPPKPEGVDEREPNSGRPIPWNTELVWALEPGHRSEPGTLWCGTLPGGLFRSRDRGASWQLIESLWNHPKRREWVGGGAELPGLHSVCVDPRDARRVAVAVSCGGAWLTRDGGASWEIRAQGMRAAYMPPERQYDPNVQ